MVAQCGQGRSRGGFSTKIHLKTDLDGYPIGFHLTGGEYPDLKIGVVPVINLEWIQKIHRDCYREILAIELQGLVDLDLTSSSPDFL